MNISLVFLLAVVILNLLFLATYSKISNLLNLYDIPDFSRKIHKKKIAASGGILFYIIFIFYNFYFFGSNENLFTFRENISLIIISSIFFIIGLIDDKFILSSNTKLYLMILFCFCLVLLNSDFAIRDLNFSFTEKKIILGDFSILFTVICILCFVNACNMFDGIDLQFGIYIIFLSLIFIDKGFMPNFHIGIIISSLFFLIISSYSKQDLLFVDEIFLCMAIPGYDLIRVSLHRLIKGKHMFSPDNQHIHHFLIVKFGTVKTNILIQISIFMPLIIYKYYESFFISFLLSFASYLFLFIYSKKKN